MHTGVNDKVKKSLIRRDLNIQLLHTIGYLSQGLPGLNNVGRGQKSRPELRTKTTEGGGENAARQHT